MKQDMNLLSGISFLTLIHLYGIFKFSLVAETRGKYTPVENARWNSTRNRLFRIFNPHFIPPLCIFPLT